MNKIKTVGVVGAGIAGLACAYELHKAGYDVTVWEKESLVGGRMSTRHHDGFHFDLGAQMLSNKYVQGKKYLNELGIGSRWGEMPLHTHIFSDGKLQYASYASTREFFQFGYMTALSKARLLLFCLLQPLVAPKVDFFDLTTAVAPSLHQKNAYDFTVKWAGKEVADKVFDALCAAYHFHHCRELSLGAMLGLMQMFDLDYIHEYTAYQMNTLPIALASRLNVRIGSAVKTAKQQSDKWVVVTASGDQAVDAVVFAAPAPAILHILTEPTQRQKTMLTSVHFASTITVAFKVPRDQVKELSLAIVPEQESHAIASYFNQEIKQQSQAQKTGHTIVTLFLRDRYARSLLDKSREEIFTDVDREFRRVCPPAKNLIPFDLQCWPAAMPKFQQPSSLLINRFWKQGQGENHVYFCGDWMNSPWIEGALRSGQRVANMIKKEGSK